MFGFFFGWGWRGAGLEDGMGLRGVVLNIDQYNLNFTKRLKLDRLGSKF